MGALPKKGLFGLYKTKGMGHHLTQDIWTLKGQEEEYRDAMSQEYLTSWCQSEKKHIFFMFPSK